MAPDRLVLVPHAVLCLCSHMSGYLMKSQNKKKITVVVVLFNGFDLFIMNREYHYIQWQTRSRQPEIKLGNMKYATI